MRFDEKTQTIRMTAGELVAIARTRSALLYSAEEEGAGCPADESRRLQLTSHREAQSLFLETSRDGISYEIEAAPDDVSGYVITVIRRVPTRPDRPSAAAVAQARGEGYCAAHILHESCGGNYRLRLIFVSDDCPVPHIVEEEPKKDAPARFFEKVMREAAVYAAPEIDRVSRRLPAIKNARFPFERVREGQQELMETVYAAIRRRRRLYACAPTGIGKTVSVLYPALRALGAGATDKIFYLTPKNTAADSARAALEKFAAAGAPVRGVCLSAKEAVCPERMLCRDRVRCSLSPVAVSRMDAAARELLSCGRAVIGQKELLEAARKHSVCPYELSLQYSMYCDVVICDYNYLFDPRVSLKRYFAQPGRFAFLIDEAHNLVERARKIYGTSLTLSYVDALALLARGQARLTAAVSAFRTCFEGMMKRALHGEVKTGADGAKHAFAASGELPEDYYGALCELVYELAEVTQGRNQGLGESEKPLRAAYYELRNILDKLSLYDERFVTFYRFEGGDFECRTVCLDPAEVVGARLSLGESAVLFSATLTPLSYYREVLGGRRDSMTIDVPSPFDENRLCVAVMDKISTRYLERQDTVRAVVRAILTCVKAKPGNYMVFCPSYHYMTLLHEALHRAVPKLTTLVQGKNMSAAERAAFLAAFDEHSKSALVGFCVMGGIYSEGIDLVGRRLIGAVVVGVGLPTLSDEREAIRAYFDEKNESGRAYAYVYPGMNRVLQAAGRVIRTDEDRGVVLLIDDRFGEPEYRTLIPAHWHGLHYVGDGEALTRLLGRFWGEKT